MAAEAVNPRGSSRSLPHTKPTRSRQTLTPEETFLDDIRVSLQEIEDGHVLDSKQRIRELRAELEHAKDDC
ncbi:MAG: hypothetical protein OXG78_01340 [Chloroflexi bacterium]|nr:hypothetical protein [Chloroflexota bacterium]